MSDDLTLTVGGAAISGWTEISVTRGCEICPSSFQVGMTDLYPGQAGAVVVKAGDPCTVKLGDDLVVTGYVDVVSPSYTGDSHAIRISGRGKCQDLVDCSAEYPGGQFRNMNALQIAQALAKPYGIKVSGQAGAVIPQFNQLLTESPWSVIERICRFSALLCYEGTDGNLILANLEPVTAASGPVEGQNVQSARGEYSMHDRFSDYDVLLQDMDVTQDIGNGGNLVGSTTDPNVPRHRLKAMVAEGGSGGLQLAQTRAVWESTRRIGRGYRLTVEVDSWRDSAGTLWTPNSIIPIDLPNLKVPTLGNNWVLGEVTYQRDERGTRAELVIMPDIAFLPEPILLIPTPADLTPQAGVAK